MSAPRLGELALAAGLVEPKRLEALLQVQRQRAERGDFRRLGQLLDESLRVPRGKVRELLRQQGVQIVRCELCGARFSALAFQGGRPCLRCGRRLAPTPDLDPLAVEDTIADPGPQGDALVLAWRARNPRFGRYELLGEVGRGGMGVIFKAWDPQHGRCVALKFLQRTEGMQYEDVERFRREAKTVAGLRHEAIVPAYGLEEAGDVLCMVMEYVPGVPLDVLVRRGALTPFQVVQMCARVARALHHAHTLGLTHRDVKPGNIVVAHDGRPFLLDFGVAKDKGESVSLTLEGEVLGSLAYMAPEYLTLGVSAIGPQCDVYGLGVVLYEASTGGKHPYGEGTDEELVVRIVREPPTPVAQQNPNVPPALARVIDRAVAKDRAQRHPTAEALAQDLEGWLAAVGA